MLVAIQDDGHTCIGGGNGSEVQKKHVVTYHTLSLLKRRRKTGQQDMWWTKDERWETTKYKTQTFKKKFSPSSNALAILEYE